MSFFDPQNPGIGGLKELTTAEQLFLTTLAGVSWTQGSIPFINSSGFFTQNNSNFFWDNTNNRLGIGTSSPAKPLDVRGGTVLWGADNTGSYALEVKNLAGTSLFSFRGYGDGLMGATTYWGSYNSANFMSAGSQGVSSNQATGNPFITWKHNNGTYAVEVKSNSNIILQRTGTGNVGIGTASPSHLFEVAGVAYVSGSVLTGAVTSLNSGAVLTVGNGAATTLTFDKSVASGGTANAWFTGSNVGIGTTSPTTKLQLGNLTSNGSTSVFTIGHNGTTSSSGDGTATIKFASQYSNYPFTMGAEGNGYNFYIRQTNGGQGTFGWNFGTISSNLYTMDLKYVTDHYEQIFGGRWLTSFSGSGATSLNSGVAKDFYGLKNTITPNDNAVMYDTLRIERGQANGFYPVSNDPIMSLFAGDSTATITATNRYVWRVNRIGFNGIGTTNAYADPNHMIQAAITVDQGSKTGVKFEDGTTAMQVHTTGASTTVNCIGNANGVITMGLIVGSKITANGATRTIVSITNAFSFVVDSAVNWDNGGAGYNFTYINPYISLQDGATKYFQVASNGDTLINGNLTLGTAGNKINITEGTNATVGVATLVAGTVTVNTTAVTANSRIFLTRQTTAGTLGTSVDVTARVAGTSFTITSNGSVLDTSTVAWLIIN